MCLQVSELKFVCVPMCHIQQRLVNESGNARAYAHPQANTHDGTHAGT